MPRKKLDRGIINVRCDRATPEILKKIAKEKGFIYDSEGATGQLLDAIASGEYKLISKEVWNKCLTLMEEIKYNSNREVDVLPHLKEGGFLVQ